MDHLVQIILLLAVAVATIIVFQRLHVPTSLGYLLVGLILGPHTIGPTVHVAEFKVLAEFGVVFLLFSIGLAYSLPQLHAMRHQILGLGTAQVVLTTALVAVLLWLAGQPPVLAFVVGAVFAQSSSTIIGRQLAEQGEDASAHGRLGLAISVFQDVTAVPLPDPDSGARCRHRHGQARRRAGLGHGQGRARLYPGLLCRALGLASALHLVAERRSAELFTLTVLLVVLLAAWTTHSLGLSLAFGAFLAGMMLGETEFRHQVESSIRPFRDVLLGLFFVGIGMLIEPAALPRIWHWALLGALLLLLGKILVVVLIVRRSGMESVAAWRTALLLAVGGEFGFALLAIALDASVLDPQAGQIVLNAVLLADRWRAAHPLQPGHRQPAGPAVRRTAAAHRAAGRPAGPARADRRLRPGRPHHRRALKSSGVDFVAFDTDPKRVQQGRSDGHAVLYGDIADPELLSAARAEQAGLAIVTVDSHAVALRAVTSLRQHCPQLPVIARARDLQASSALISAGAIHAYPEAIESSLRLGAIALRMLQVPTVDIDQMLQDIRDWDYQPVIEQPLPEDGR